MRTTGSKTLGIALGIVVLAALVGATSGISTQQIRTAAPGAMNVSGVAPAEGTSLSVARADHAHSLSGVLPVAAGGTASTATPTAGGIGYGTGTAHAYTSAGAANQLLVSGGTGAPVFVAGLTFAASTNTLLVSGPINSTADITAYVTSDARLKTHVRPIPDPLWRLGQLRGVEYDWIPGPSGKTGPGAGVIAQEVQAVLPSMVSTSSTGYLGLKLGDHALTGLLIEAVKAQQDQIRDLEGRLGALEVAHFEARRRPPGPPIACYPSEAAGAYRCEVSR